MDLVDADVIDGPTARCWMCGRETTDLGLIGKRCDVVEDGRTCRGRWILNNTVSDEHSRRGLARTIVAGPATPVSPELSRVPEQRLTVEQQSRNKHLSDSAKQLIVDGINENTLKAYRQAVKPYELWGEETQRTIWPSDEETMVSYIDLWRTRPIHNKCVCRLHRPSPSYLWIWYSGVRFFHSVQQPPLPWYGGKQLELAMISYSNKMVEGGWSPRKAPRLYEEEVRRLVDCLDLATPKHLRDRAIILTAYYTAARASDLCSYRLSDVKHTPEGIELWLRNSKTNKRVGKKIEYRVLVADYERPQYCAVEAIHAWTNYLQHEHAITEGALFRPFDRYGKLLRGKYEDISYKFDGMSVTGVVREAAIRADIPRAEEVTCHSLRRSRATRLRELGVDGIDIADLHGWVRGGSVNDYLEEVARWSSESPARVGLL